ncbi:MAG: S-layer homology domain-containing protein, partial [Clostridiales Family XIII bacterium]|nr:S-layer homology domain-containing protein [Clostridiales Family XIII bacterium]
DGERDGVTWVGFSSNDDANEYGGTGGFDVGYLVFEYTGDADNTVTLTACTVYTMNASGKVARDVRGAAGTVTIKRPAAADETPTTPTTPGTGGGGGSVAGTAAEDEGFVIGEDETPLWATGARFSDLTQAEWAREAIEYMADNKGILGMGDGLFAPNAEVTRAQFARFAAQALDIGRGTEPAVFADVAEGAWYFEDVTTLASAGILTGYGDGRFGPDDRITREQMATVIDRALTAKGIALTEIRAFDLTDGDAASAYAKASIERLYGAGVVNGMGDGTFAPKATATRAQACVILYNALRTLNLL